MFNVARYGLDVGPPESDKMSYQATEMGVIWHHWRALKAMGHPNLDHFLVSTIDTSHSFYIPISPWDTLQFLQIEGKILCCLLFFPMA